MPAPTAFDTPDQQDHERNPAATLLCFSHLRWDFVFQRPQHLMVRFAGARRVLFWEEPRFADDVRKPGLSVTPCANTGVVVLTPLLPSALAGARTDVVVGALLTDFLAREAGPLIRWYYTPMMLPFSEHVPAHCVVYDCMDELSCFKGAPPGLLDLEARLLAQADLVFTGGRSLYEAKRDRHACTHLFASSVDVTHFGAARQPGPTPVDQAALASPRLGYCGVIDERMDLELLAALADAHPEWSIVMVGPVVKISTDHLPRRSNIHYLGSKAYDTLPDYLRGWDVALMPFAINEATRFISPTKTPEYLAAGLPVVSTPIADVATQYGGLEAVGIAADGTAFVAACETALGRGPDGEWRDAVDAVLAENSWDRTFARMTELIDATIAERLELQPVMASKVWPVPAAARYDVMVVGAGFAGAVMAERLAADAGKKVLVVDRRPHVAGNAYDRYDAAGILIHHYGPHIFHTNAPGVFEYLSRFTEWRPYEHRVLADVDGKLVPMPINRTTLNALYGADLKTDEETEAFLARRAERVDVVRTSADVVISRVGRELYDTFFRGYTRKQWGMDPSELDQSVTARVPTRANTDDRYFTDTIQAMPLDGYTKMFERMLDHPNIDVLLGVDYQDARAAYLHDHLVFTGPIDEYFGYRFGKLPYRSLQFKHETIDCEWFQPVAVVNYPSESVPHTRITEYKYLTGQQAPRTSITYEIPSAEGDPYYPIPREENQALFKRYEALAIAQADVTFVGRLATYRYYNMDQVVGQALSVFRRLAAKLKDEAPKMTAARPPTQPTRPRVMSTQRAAAG